MMKTVFVLENGRYSDKRIVGIYSTRGGAEIAARIFKDDASIEEWEIDEKVAEMRRGCVLFFVRLNRDSGNVENVHEDYSSYGVFSDEVGEDIHKNLYTHCWAQDRTHAIKIASDRRAQFLALASVSGAAE